MLPSELVAAWKRKGMVWPRYSKFSEDDLSVANKLIGTYCSHIGQKKSKLKEFADELEGKGFEYRFVRGLAFLLEKRSLFRRGDKVNAVELRRKIFEKSVEMGIPTSPQERKSVVEAVAAELGINTQDADKYLYADLDSELILEKFEIIPALELLKEYNFSLTQTLLFDSTEVRFTTTGNWQNIFHAVKRLGLIYEIENNSRLWVKVDGPSSLFKLTRRYGASMAKLLPAIIANPHWTFEAKILWKYTNEICSFKLEGLKHGFLFKTPQTLEVTYDSSVERDFASRFDELKSEWILRREPEPISAEKQVMIPDFSFERDGVKVYMEIVGFWTNDYLVRKIAKLKNTDVKMIVAVNKDLACEKIQSLGNQSQFRVVLFKKHIPLISIVRILEDAFKGTHMAQLELMRSIPIVFTEPVVDYAEFAQRTGLSPETVKKVLTETPPPAYVTMSTIMVRKDKLEQVARKIEEKANRPDRLPLTDALKIVEAEGIGDAANALEHLGYKIVWRGIDVEKAEVTKAKKVKM